MTASLHQDVLVEDLHIDAPRQDVYSSIFQPVHRQDSGVRILECLPQYHSASMRSAQTLKP